MKFLHIWTVYILSVILFQKCTIETSREKWWINPEAVKDLHITRSHISFICSLDGYSIEKVIDLKDVQKVFIG